MCGKGKARAIQPFRHIACRIDADEEEWHALLPGPAQRGQAVCNLFETGAEQPGERLDIIGARLDRAGKPIIGHDHRRRGIAGQRAPHQLRRRRTGKALVVHHRGDFAAHRGIGDVRGDLPLPRGGGQTVVEQKLFAMPVIAAQRAHHHLGRQKPQAYAMVAQPVGLSPGACHFVGQCLGARIKRREMVARAGDEPARLAHRIAARIGARAFAQAGQRLLFAGIGAVQAQHRLGHAGKAGGDVGHFERGQVDFGKNRVFQHRRQALCIIVARVAGQFAHVQFVTACKPQQQIGGQRALVALDQRDIAGRNIQVVSHGRLSQAQFAAQPLDPGAKIERAGVGHGDLRTRLHNCTSIFCKV
jgi:hypothetical protein